MKDKNIWGEIINPIKEKNKWGFEVVRFRNRPAEQIENMLDSALFVAEYFKDKFDLDIHLAYGTLLGGVRDGGLIKHDDDFDFSYISKFSVIEEIVRETKDITEMLRQDDMLASVVSDAHFIVRKNGFYFDITLSWLQEHFYNLYYLSYMTVLKSTILPFNSINIFGRDFKIPNSPQHILKDLYGDGWEISKPDYHPGTDRWNIEKNFMVFRKGFALWDKYF